LLEDTKIKEWVETLSTPKEQLGNFPICPFSSNASYTVEYTDGSDIDPPPWDFELIIYVLPDYDEDTVIKIAQEYNKMFPNLVFLPDPKDRKTYINGVLTSNGNRNLILCQYREKLNAARQKLARTDYYKFWDEEYLMEILNT